MKTITLLAGLVAFSGVYGQNTRSFNLNELNESEIKTYHSNISISDNSERSTVCGDTTYYPIYKGNVAGEFPLVTDGVSFEALSQTYYNTSNITLTGVRIWLSNPGVDAIDATIHAYTVGASNEPVERIAWADATVQPGLYQSADFYFNTGVEVSTNFAVTLQALPNGLSDTINVAYNLSGRAENLAYAGWHDGSSLGAWLSALDPIGLDGDYMIFPIYEFELTSDFDMPTSALVNQDFTVTSNADYIAFTDSMLNFSYFFSAQLYTDFYDETSAVEAQKYNELTSTYAHDAVGTYEVGHASVWFKWTTLFLDMNDPGFVPYYCFDETVKEIEIVEEQTVGIEENDVEVVFNNETLTFSNTNAISLVNVYSVSGQLIQTLNVYGNQAQLAPLAAGVYVAELVKNNGATQQFKFIK